MEMYKYKIDTNTDGNFMLIKMFKTIFPHTKITYVNNTMDRKIILHDYNNSCVPQMGVCRVTIINKGIEFQCSVSLVLGNGLVLLGMPNCQRLQQLSINCHTMNDEQKDK